MSSRSSTPRPHRVQALFIVALAAWGLSACEWRPHAQTDDAASRAQALSAAQTAPAGPRPLASIQEIMQAMVDPSADALWEAVSTTVTAKGEEEKRPRGDEDWRQLRHHALTLSESATLLTTGERAVAHAGKTLEDAHVSATLSAPEIDKRIKADRAAFAARALALQVAAQRTLAAIDARDIDAYMRAGAQLDQACESCHQRYWYPNDRRP